MTTPKTNATDIAWSLDFVDVHDDLFIVINFFVYTVVQVTCCAEEALRSWSKYIEDLTVQFVRKVLE